MPPDWQGLSSPSHSIVTQSESSWMFANCKLQTVGRAKVMDLIDLAERVVNR